jgi:hypothetical protein
MQLAFELILTYIKAAMAVSTGLIMVLQEGM